MPKTRKELVEYWKQRGWVKGNAEEYHNMSHEEKANPETFRYYCEKISSYMAVLLSDDEICDNKELMLIAANTGYGFNADLQMLSDRLLDDPDIALALAGCNKREYSKISKRLRSDAELMLKAVKKNPGVYYSLPMELKLNEEILMEIIRSNPSELDSLRKLKNEKANRVFSNKEIAIEVAKRSPYLIGRCFNEDIKSDWDILSLIVYDENGVANKDKIRKEPWSLQYIDKEIWVNDKKLITDVLRKDADLYSILPEKYRDDKKIALLALKGYCNILEYCSERLKDDEELLFKVANENPEDVLFYASDRLKSDYGFVYKMVEMWPLNLEYASDELKDNLELVTMAIKRGGMLIHASARLQENQELIRLEEEYDEL